MAENDQRGRRARRPTEIPFAGWKDIGGRVYEEFVRDRLMLVAAGVAFYLLLAIFPAIAAFVSLYGMIGDPQSLAEYLRSASGVIPPEVSSLLQDQLTQLADQSGAPLSLGAIAGLGVALWSANAGMKALFEGMNVVYDEQEQRSFLKLTAETLLATIGVIALLMAFIFLVGILPVMMAAIGLEDETAMLVSLLRWPVLLILAAIGISLLYQYGPCRNEPKFRWVTWGGALATVVWIVASLAFSFYLQNFANYSALYGSLGTAIGFLMWMWVSCLILLLGAEVNAEIEHQVAHDTTERPNKPMGQRGARMADTVGESADRVSRTGASTEPAPGAEGHSDR